MTDKMDSIFDIAPYSMARAEKVAFLQSSMSELTQFHYDRCSEYKAMIDALFGGCDFSTNLDELPYLPVGVFKHHRLKSIPDDEVFKYMRSSGTSGQRPSEIVLDKKTANLQTKGLTKTLNGVLGGQRLPMLVVDSEDALGANANFSARGAAIRGFSMFGRRPVFALDHDLKPDLLRIKSFFDQHKDKAVFVFGFTFLIWTSLCETLAELDIQIDMSNAILLHGGGWKKLVNKAVSPAAFKERLKQQFNISRIHDYYGMVEQTGSIYVECDAGHLHCSVFNDVLIKDVISLENKNFGEEGLIQTLSIFPYSYPGHSILTEDLGMLLGEDDCPCGRKGKYFRVLGRLAEAEIRGCSDTL
ncbi:acyl-protein synthetase [uncultured Roseibium sp.]|uniref:LuxE/PaaK family acyltransferase n=1 Tax=uncultured Roseibium sp. TaxID=1936171 RepID=UPI002613D7EC|nr:acyl-protein synthetase [uncultured Roseibium sp.]